MSGIKKVQLLLSMSIFSLLFCTLLVRPVLADVTDPLSVACSQTPDSDVCRSRATTAQNPISGTGGILIRASNIIAVVTGVAASIMIIIAGIRYTMSQGDAKSVSGAKNQIIYSLVGIVVVILARSIIVFVVNKL
jgi:hypothetical protein